MTKDALLSLIRSICVLANGISWLFIGILLGAKFLGNASFALAVSAILVTIFGGGLDASAFYLKQRFRRRAMAMLVLKISLGIISGIVTFFIVKYFYIFNSDEFAVASAMLSMSAISSISEARLAGCEGPRYPALVVIVTTPFSLLSRFIAAIYFDSVTGALVSCAIFEFVKVFLCWKTEHYLWRSPTFTRRYARYCLSLIILSFSYYLANIFSVIYQKTIAVIVGFHFGPQVTGKIVAHISAVDAYSSFCSTFSQFIYKGKVLNVDPSSLEKAIRKFAIFTWLLVISTIITIIIFLPKEIMFGKIAINPFYISILVPSIIVLAFGSVFTHWMVVNNQQKKIPKYHFISLISLITFLILLKPLGPIAAILSRTLSALSGHAGMAILFKSERKQWWILCKCMIWPFSLEK